MVASPSHLPPLPSPPGSTGRGSGTDRSVTRHVAIRRDAVDPTRRIVWGEVMVPPKVDIVPGGTYRESEVGDALHYDNLFLNREAVHQLAYRMHGIRIDVGHDNEPIHATLAENYVARSGDPVFAEGSHVVGARIGEGATYVARDGRKRDVWQGIAEDTDLTGFSIDFRILARKFDITVTDEDGGNPRTVRVEEGTDPRPVFLSIVGGPAIGRHFAAAARGVVDYQDLPLAAEDAEWNAAAAVNRVRQWATTDTGVDTQRFARAFVLRNEDDPALLGGYRLSIADVVGGRLVAVPRAIDAAAAALDATPMTETERTAAEAHLGRYFARLRRTPPWVATDNAQPADAARATDEEASVPTPDPAIADEERAIGASLLDTIVAAVRRRFVTTDEPAEDAATEPESDDAASVEAPAADVARGAFAEVIGQMGVNEAFNAAWLGFDALSCAFWEVYETGDSDADKLAAMAEAAEEFGAWLAAEIRRIAATEGGADTMRDTVKRLRSVFKAAPDGDLIERARSFDALGEQVAQLEDAKRAVDERLAAAETEAAEAVQRAAAVEAERDGLLAAIDEHVATVNAMRAAAPPGTALPGDTSPSANGGDEADTSPHSKLRGSGLAPTR